MEQFFQDKPWYFVYGIGALAFIVGSYALAFVVYLVFYRKYKEKLKEMKVQPKYPSHKLLKHEFKLSFIDLLIQSFGGAIITYAYFKGHTFIYTDIHEYGYVYFAVSFILMLLIHDTYFYWTHRLIHIPGIYKYAHKWHHISVNPSPWAAFSHHPIESVISMGIFPILAWVMPCHWLALTLFVLYMTVMNVMAHNGFELYSKKFMNSLLGRSLTNVTHHNMHHRHFFYNFGLYFSFWDKIMHTEWVESASKKRKV